MSPVVNKERRQFFSLRWRRNNPIRYLNTTRWAGYRRKYGITYGQYQDLVELQHGRCKICRESGVKLHTDHDHNTGKVRGLLCANCNTAIGMLKEKPLLFMRAVLYLAGRLGNQ